MKLLASADKIHSRFKYTNLWAWFKGKFIDGRINYPPKIPTDTNEITPPKDFPFYHGHFINEELEKRRNRTEQWRIDEIQDLNEKIAVTEKGLEKYEERYKKAKTDYEFAEKMFNYFIDTFGYNSIKSKVTYWVLLGLLGTIEIPLNFIALLALKLPIISAAIGIVGISVAVPLACHFIGKGLNQKLENYDIKNLLSSLKDSKFVQVVFGSNQLENKEAQEVFLDNLKEIKFQPEKNLAGKIFATTIFIAVTVGLVILAYIRMITQGEGESTQTAELLGGLYAVIQFVLFLTGVYKSFLIHEPKKVFAQREVKNVDTKYKGVAKDYRKVERAKTQAEMNLEVFKKQKEKIEQLAIARKLEANTEAKERLGTYWEANIKARNRALRKSSSQLNSYNNSNIQFVQDHSDKFAKKVVVQNTELGDGFGHQKMN